MATAARKPAAATAKTEANDAEVAFAFEGKSYVVPTASEWDLPVLEAYEEGRVIAFTRELLGPDQWAAFKSKPRKVADITALFEAIESATVGPGN
jgi:hypothetical protein